MSKELNALPVVTREESTKNSRKTKGCGSGACSGGFGIRPGSEKPVVYRNIITYTLMGVVMLFSAYATLKIIGSILG